MCQLCILAQVSNEIKTFSHFPAFFSVLSGLRTRSTRFCLKMLDEKRISRYNLADTFQDASMSAGYRGRIIMFVDQVKITAKAGNG
ncbi:MAG: hypothetical protein J6I98_04315, partial [Clostridia bacterium]|nr:hypothetical protein [Clostridia bacterium]